MVALCSRIPSSSNDAQNEVSDLKFLRTALLPIFIYSLFWGIRYDVGTDHLAYATKFALGYNDERLEIGYLWLVKLLQAISLPYPFLFIITSMVNICSVFLLAKGRDSKLLSLLVLFFWTSETVYFAQNGLRQMFAISLIFFGINNLCRNKYIHGVAFFVSASLFHTSSVVFSLVSLMVWMLSNSEKISINKYIVLAVYLGMEGWGQVFTITDIPLLNNLSLLLGYEHHFDKLESWEFEIVEGTGIGAILRMVLFSCIILSQDKLFENKDRLKITFYWLFILGAVLHPVLNSNMILNRFCIYFSSTYFVTFAFFSYELWEGNISNKNVSRLVLLFFILCNLSFMSKNCCTNGCREYQTIFSSQNTTLKL